MQVDFDEKQISKTGRISWKLIPKEQRYWRRGGLRWKKNPEIPIFHISKEEMRENFKAALTEEIIEENPGMTSVI